MVYGVYTMNMYGHGLQKNFHTQFPAALHITTQARMQAHSVQVRHDD